MISKLIIHRIGNAVGDETAHWQFTYDIDNETAEYESDENGDVSARSVLADLESDGDQVVIAGPSLAVLRIAETLGCIREGGWEPQAMDWAWPS